MGVWVWHPQDARFTFVPAASGDAVHRVLRELPGCESLVCNGVALDDTSIVPSGLLSRASHHGRPTGSQPFAVAVRSTGAAFCGIDREISDSGLASVPQEHRKTVLDAARAGVRLGFPPEAALPAAIIAASRHMADGLNEVATETATMLLQRPELAHAAHPSPELNASSSSSASSSSFVEATSAGDGKEARFVGRQAAALLQRMAGDCFVDRALAPLASAPADGVAVMDSVSLTIALLTRASNARPGQSSIWSLEHHGAPFAALSPFAARCPHPGSLQCSGGDAFRWIRHPPCSLPLLSANH